MFSRPETMSSSEGNNNLSPGGLERFKRSNSIAGEVRLPRLPAIKLSAASLDRSDDADLGGQDDSSMADDDEMRGRTPSPSFLAVPAARARKFSLPNILGDESALAADVFLDASRRRLSQVSLAVSQHLQSTIGWKAPPNEALIGEQAKCLAAKYLHFKLRKCGLIHKKLRFPRLRSAMASSLGDTDTDTDTDPDGSLNRIALELRYIIQELERASPKLYQSVTQQIGFASALFASPAALRHVHHLLARELCRDEVTWAKVGALYAATGALAVDCVRGGHPDYVLELVDSLADFVAQDLAVWLSQQGGWVKQKLNKLVCRLAGLFFLLTLSFCVVMPIANG